MQFPEDTTNEFFSDFLFSSDSGERGIDIESLSSFLSHEPSPEVVGTSRMVAVGSGQDSKPNEPRYSATEPMNADFPDLLDMDEQNVSKLLADKGVLPANFHWQLIAEAREEFGRVSALLEADRQSFIEKITITTNQLSGPQSAVYKQQAINLVNEKIGKCREELRAKVNELLWTNLSDPRNVTQKRQRTLPPAAVKILKEWFFAHIDHPIPNEGDKTTLAQVTGLTKTQVNNWFVNARARLLRGKR
eukprot:GEZU01023621.1.p1 GENE.GEZU01023621.1~~GEZU01023621.1.p1  ORF type:complete len:247 (+),score=16.56 GEZU01023621.1:533-1273(+)